MAHLREQLDHAHRKGEEKEALSQQANARWEAALSSLRSDYERSRGNQEERHQVLADQLLDTKTEIARKEVELSGVQRELQGLKEVGVAYFEGAWLYEGLNVHVQGGLGTVEITAFIAYFWRHNWIV